MTTVTLGSILADALAKSKPAKPERPVPTGMWNIIYGDPAVPKADWMISEYDITDPKVGQERVRALNEQQIKCYDRWLSKEGDNYSEIINGVRHYRVQTNTPPRRSASYNRFTLDYDYSPEVEFVPTFAMLTEREAETVSRGLGRNFYSYYYDKPSDAPFRYSLRKVSVEQDYVAREAARTDNPIRLPAELKEYVSSYNSYHCAEIIPPATISYFRSREDAWDNKRTEMKLGRYLREFAPSLDDQTIGEACAKIGVSYVTDVVLKMARTREEIRHVYVEGPNSCMSGSDNIMDGVHPVECYASDDLAVAYLDRDGEITARTIVNPMKMQYLRIYGDNTRLSIMLEKLGYTQSCKTLGNAKLLKIPVTEEGYNNYVFLPYLDGDYSEVLDMGDHFKVKTPPQTYSGNTEGYVRLRA